MVNLYITDEYYSANHIELANKLCEVENYYVKDESGIIIDILPNKILLAKQFLLLRCFYRNIEDTVNINDFFYCIQNKTGYNTQPEEPINNLDEVIAKLSNIPMDVFNSYGYTL